MGQNSDREHFEQRQFGQHLEFGETPALLIVDVMNAFTDESYDLGANLDDEIASITRLETAARDADVPIIYVYSAYSDEELNSDVLWLEKQGGADVLSQDSDAVALDDRLSPRRADTRIRKRYASAFFATDLRTRLNTRGIDTVVLTGTTTSGCVRASAVDAVQSGYVPVVPRQSVGDRDEAAHEQALFDLEMKYADVVDEAAVRNYFETETDPLMDTTGQ